MTGRDFVDHNRFAASSAVRREILKARQILETFDRCRNEPAADFRAKYDRTPGCLG